MEGVGHIPRDWAGWDCTKIPFCYEFILFLWKELQHKIHLVYFHLTPMLDFYYQSPHSSRTRARN